MSAAFGEPAAIVATGSVVQGFANAESDVDLFVVVDAESVSRLPIPSFAQGTLIDTVYHRRHDLEPVAASTIEAGATPLGGESAWHPHRRSLDTLNRFALGEELVADESIERWLSSLRNGVLQQTIVDWWVAVRLDASQAPGIVAELAWQAISDQVRATEHAERWPSSF